MCKKLWEHYEPDLILDFTTGWLHKPCIEQATKPTNREESTTHIPKCRLEEKSMMPPTEAHCS
jgi:hypothetical protein